MTIQNVEAADAEVTVNMELARSYQKALRNLSEKDVYKRQFLCRAARGLLRRTRSSSALPRKRPIS